MKIHEYQAKSILARYGMPVPHGEVAFSAIEAGEIRLDEVVTYSARAGMEPASKMGFQPGTKMRLDDALRMMMVKSANDIAVEVAEAVGKSTEASRFSEKMDNHFMYGDSERLPEHIVALGDDELGEVRAEVGIALPPDDQCRRRDRAKLCRGFLLGLSYRGAVVVDHPGSCPRLRPRLDIAFDFLRRVRRVRVLQEVSEEVPVSGVHHALGQSRNCKEEEVPGLPKLVRVAQSL